MSTTKKAEETEEETTEVQEESDDGLISMETIDRESPDLWPEKSMNEFMSTYSSTNTKLPYSKDFNTDDTTFLNQLLVLSTEGLITKVKDLHDVAYQLGIEESKEMTRGKCLKIFDKTKRST